MLGRGGGNIVLTPGAAGQNGTAGTISLNSDTTVDGTLTVENGNVIGNIVGNIVNSTDTTDTATMTILDVGEVEGNPTLAKYIGNIYNLQDYPILTIVDSQGLPNAVFTGDVAGDLTGNIKNDIGDTILSNGDSSTPAVFTGDVTGDIKNHR